MQSPKFVDGHQFKIVAFHRSVIHRIVGGVAYKTDAGLEGIPDAKAAALIVAMAAPATATEIPRMR